jgi:hypothetical protein
MLKFSLLTNLLLLVIVIVLPRPRLLCWWKRLQHVYCGIADNSIHALVSYSKPERTAGAQQRYPS